MLKIIRGLPGSGKSTLAKTFKMPHYEADMFFMEDGEYKFDYGKIKQAHQWCQDQVRKHLSEGQSVVVSNTFVKEWEMQPYIDMANEFGHEIEIITTKGNWPNVHGVPQEVIDRMRENWEVV